jgi:hypothetical protein
VLASTAFGRTYSRRGDFHNEAVQDEAMVEAGGELGTEEIDQRRVP